MINSTARSPTLNRVVAPCSKLAFGTWWAMTAADRWVKVPAAALDHRRFWEAMDALDQASLAGIESRLGQRMVKAHTAPNAPCSWTGKASPCTPKLPPRTAMTHPCVARP